MLPQIKKENEAWREKYLPELRLFQAQRENAKKNYQKSLNEKIEQIIWRAEMNLTTDNKAIIGLAHEYKKLLDKERQK